MARIENQRTGNTTRQADLPPTKQPISKAAAAGAIVGALVVFGLAGYLLTRDSTTTTTTTPTITPEMRRAGAQQSNGSANTNNGNPAASGIPSAMRGVGAAPQGAPSAP